MTSAFGGTFSRRAASGLVFLALVASFLIVPVQPALAAGTATITFASGVGTQSVAMGRYVRMQLRNVGYARLLNLAELQVLQSGQNIALGKPASESSVFNADFPASKAVDGDATTFAHTYYELSPWIQVDLGSVQQLDQIVLINRQDCCGEREFNFDVLVSNDGTSWTSVYYQPGTMGSSATIASSLDSLIQFSTDGGASWQQAPIVSPHPAWSTIAGTRWVSVSPDRVGPAAGADFRFTFTLPEGARSPSLSFSILADNAATIFLNGVIVGGQPVANCPGANFGGPATTISTSNAGLFQPGVNTVVINDDNGFRGCNPPFNFPNDMGIDFVATLTFSVEADTTPPVTTSTSSPGPNSNGWNSTDVTVTFSATDNPGGSGVVSTSVTDNGQAATLVAGALQLSSAGTHVLSYFSVDKAGNVETAKTLTVNMDKTAPSISAAAAGTLGTNGWYTSPVTITFTCADTLSGIASCPPAVTFSGDGAHQTASGTATDKAGNTASTSLTVNIDRTAPTISATAATASGQSYVAGSWTNETVTVTFNCADATSGIASCPAPVSLSGEGETASVSGTATDKAGNTASTTFGPVRIDKTPPEAVNQFEPATLDLTVSGRDTLSGIAAVTVTTAAAPKKGPVGGDKAVRRTYVITDRAGNRTTLVEDVRKAGNELKATKVSVQYGSQPAIPFPENELKFEWALDKSGALKELEQEITIGKGEARQEVEAKFEAKKGTTTIRVERPKPETKTVQAGPVFLKLVTANGELKIGQ